MMPRFRHLFKALLLTALAATLLTACGPKKDVAMGGFKPKPTVQSRLAMPPQSSQAIRNIMEQARESGDPTEALAILNELAVTSPPPLNEEAMFRRVELMLEFLYPEAEREARLLLANYPQHALTPYAHFWIANWQLTQQQENRAFAELAKVLSHPRLTRELADQSLDLGTPLAQRAGESEALEWFLAAARIDLIRQEHWLRMAAARASMQSITRLHTEQRLHSKPFNDFYLHAARLRLMGGNIEEVQAIAALLATDMPYDPITRKIESWASGKLHGVTIGVMLPLTGQYARFGQEALRGIRLAVAREQQSSRIILRIEDTGDGVEAAIAAYKKLAYGNVDWIIGPLLADHTEALLPHMRADLPVISLTSQVALAEAARNLFIHSLARTTQASFMAEHAWQQGIRKAVVLSGAERSESEEGRAFAETFQALGGEVVEQMELESGAIDHRQALIEMRSRTDNEELLAELDEELWLFTAETELEIRIPVHFDAVYLALPGRGIASLAAQLAYVGVSGTPYYGSSRWQDGHLLDDRGRYLSTARFAHIAFPDGNSAELARMKAEYLGAWGQGVPGKLFGIAYDSVTIAAVISGRLGLTGRDAMQALHDNEGFPGLTGHVHFDKRGIGLKSYDLFRVHGGEIVPAG